MPASNVVVFSDRLGVGFGPLLFKSLKCKITNNCMPEASLKQIVRRIENSQFDGETIVVILLGNSENLTKKNIIQSFSILSTLSVKKIFLCALPYCRLKSTEENYQISIFNNLLYNLTERHRDMFVFFDTNKFTNNKFVLTGGSIHLPYKLKKQIANLLAYNINIINDKKISTRTNVNIIPLTSSEILN